MVDTNVTTLYNYDEFVSEKYQRFMKFEDSPPAGELGPDFPLWQLDDRAETSLLEITAQHAFTIVEFGSFT